MNQEQNNFNTEINNNVYPETNNSNTEINYNSNQEPINLVSETPKVTPPKKFNIGIIAGVAAVGVVVTVAAVLLGTNVFNNKENNDKPGNSVTGNKDIVITEKDIAKYNLENDTAWINKAIGITYNIPKKISESAFNGSSSFSYMHGSSYGYYAGYDIYVDKSLEGHTNLETLASDIISEKFSPDYEKVYNFGSSLLTTFENEKTEKVKIANYDTVYFESKVVADKIKFVGYSFVYNGNYISVYGELPTSGENKLKELKQILQYIIFSIKPHNGESIEELGGNVKEYFDDGFTNYFDDNASAKFTINHPSRHSLNGILKTDSDVFVKLNKDYINWDGTLEGIFNATSNIKLYYSEYSKKNVPYYSSTFEWYDPEEVDGKWKNTTSYEIIKDENVTINGTNMKKYIVKTRTGTQGGSYVVVYTFIYDGQPYVFQYNLSYTIYKNNPFNSLTEKKADIIIKQTEAVADTIMLTFRTLNSEEKYSQYIDIY